MDENGESIFDEESVHEKAVADEALARKQDFITNLATDNQKYQINTGMQDIYYDMSKISEDEKKRITEKWRSSQISEYWRESKGDFIKVQMLNNNRDLREMRLIFKRGSKQDAFIEGEIADIIDSEIKNIMKETCGRKSKSQIMVYNNPSFELVRASPFYDYEVVSQGASVREVGFKCVY
jgi:hypothetical protein